ncbi:hypothetical protein HK097_006911 [Rhizophlyctis rosea]|uniref:Uncharacterized protein n=1 Tax=Rhizophlyctis rosea TaxID=64517 RepID=A0AAD5X4Z1_9FUNG|nr:hypothetical protein HK097_006911 [Rhizophlyctis rosea]
MSSPINLSSSPTDTKPPSPTTTNPFNSRTVTYIRIGPNQALRVIFFLRRKDWEWFDKERLHKVVQALFPLIPARLNSIRGVGGKEAKDAGFAEVYRDVDWQMSYYFKSTDVRHSVMMKQNETYNGLMVHPKTLAVIVEPFVPGQDTKPPDFIGFNYLENLIIHTSTDDSFTLNLA